MPLYEKPQKGQRIAWRMDGKLKFHCTVLRVEGNLCWCQFDHDGSRDPFIWQFKDELNQIAEVVEEKSLMRNVLEAIQGQ